jgi:hypothetical protein
MLVYLLANTFNFSNQSDVDSENELSAKNSPGALEGTQRALFPVSEASSSTYT